jgi:hypothetical protein
VQIGGINITVGQHDALRQSSESGDHRGLACSSLAADDGEFFHRLVAWGLDGDQIAH